MKTAYEIAMERLNRQAPIPKLTADQKKALAELDSLYTAKLAERELALRADIARAEAAGDFETMEKLQAQLSAERRKLRAELEEKKERIRLGQG